MARVTIKKTRTLLAGILASMVAGPLFAAGATQTTLHNFSGGDGSRPSSALIIGADGNFYGTTLTGGNAGAGSVFKMSATDGSVVTIYNFSSGDSKNDGGSPQSPLILASDGNFYGTTRGGGSAASRNAGTIFEVNTAQNNLFQTVHLFTGTDGSHPLSGLVQVGTSLYGTTSDGGGNNLGTVFSLSVTATGQLTTMHNFAGGSEGAYPMSGVIEGADGNFYGTTFGGGTSNCGTLYKLKPSGTSSVLTTLHSFSCSNDAGQDLGFPMGGLVQGLDGTLYGTTTAYGLRSSGTIFSIKPDGSSFQTLYTFTGDTDGNSPQASLVLGTDGKLYGTSPAVGQDNNLYGTALADTVFHNGTVFSFDPGNPTLTTLYGFSSAPGGSNSDGWNSVGGLMQGSDGNFYGTAANGGSGFGGTAYKITPSGGLAAPISISISPASALLGDSATLTWKLANAINTGGSASQCFAAGNDSNWTGAQAASGSLKLTYSKLGTFTYALTCGGTVTGITSITVAAIGAPTNLAAVPGDGQVTLSWDSVSGAATYNIYEGINGAPNGTPIMTGVTSTTQTITGLVNGTTYYFKVSAVTASSQEGPKSAAVVAVPTAVATTPTNLVATPKNGAVLLTWDAANGANSYNVYEGTTAGGEGASPVLSGISASGAPSATVTGLTNGTTYFFKVASVNRTQTSALSSEASATPTPPPSAPTGISATAGDGTASVSWNRVSGADSYDIYETPASGATTKIGNVLDSSFGTKPTGTFKINGLTNGKMYAFNVAAVNSAGSSAPSATVTVAPEAPASGSGGAVAPELLALMALAAARRRKMKAA